MQAGDPGHEKRFTLLLYFGNIKLEEFKKLTGEGNV
jgi:hypothetical protein